MQAFFAALAPAPPRRPEPAPAGTPLRRPADGAGFQARFRDALNRERKAAATRERNAAATRERTAAAAPDQDRPDGPPAVSGAAARPDRPAGHPRPTAAARLDGPVQEDGSGTKDPGVHDPAVLADEALTLPTGIAGPSPVLWQALPGAMPAGEPAAAPAAPDSLAGAPRSGSDSVPAVQGGGEAAAPVPAGLRALLVPPQAGPEVPAQAAQAGGTGEQTAPAAGAAPGNTGRGWETAVLPGMAMPEPAAAAALRAGMGGDGGAAPGAARGAAPDRPLTRTFAELVEMVRIEARRLDGAADPLHGAAAPADGVMPAAQPPAAAPLQPPQASVVPAPAAAPPAAPPSPRLIYDQVAEALPRVAMTVAGDRREVRIQLWPRELGEVQIKLVMDDGVLRADVVVSRPEVKAALEANLADLRQRLEQQGLQVASFQVALGGGDTGARHQRGEPAFGRRRHIPAAPAGDGAMPAVAVVTVPGAGTLLTYGPSGRRLNGLA